MDVLTGWKTVTESISFFAVLTMFGLSHLLSGQGNLLTLLCVAPVIAWPVLFLRAGHTVRHPVMRIGCLILSSAAQGIALALLACAAITLNQWYGHPDDGQLEPLFTALTLSSGAILSAEVQLRKKLGNVGDW